MVSMAPAIVSMVQWMDRHAIWMQLLLLLAVAGMLHLRAGGKVAWLWHDRPAGSRLAAGKLLWAAGLAAAVLALLAAGVHLSQASQPPRGLMALDLAVQRAVVTGLPPMLIPLVKGWTMLGDLRFMLLLGLAVALWLLWKRQGLQLLAWATVTIGVGLWIRVGKGWMQRARPADGLVPEAGFSFPSGHSAGSAAIFGMLAWLAMRRLPPRWHGQACAVAVFLALSTALSRVLLSVHYASDVLAGLALGSAWTALVLWAADRVEHGAGPGVAGRGRAQSAW